MFLQKTPLFLSLMLTLCSAQNFNLNNCASKETCSECIQELGCVWCISPLIEHLGHCLHQNQSTSQWCNPSLLENSTSSFIIVEDVPLTSDQGRVVQIRPQHVQLKLRKGEEHILQFQYEQAQNYPVDLYYIMDLSKSMEQHREKLAKLGNKLATTMRNITSNFRLGFGSFVDKVELPFVSTVPSSLIRPCSYRGKKGETINCHTPYSFKNHMSLSDNYQKFADEVSGARVSGNLDSPEGGFDGLMQAMVCKTEIGWRAKARHLVVFSTDAGFHIAGDGKLAGVIEPNDAKCHMKKNQYTHDLKLDYPSVSQINYVAKENNVNIIFAIVKNKYVQVYKKLSEAIENSNMGALDEKSENVIKLVLDNYNKIVDSVTLSTNSSSDVEIKISSNCPYPKVNGCTNIHVGEVVNFTATIKPLKCAEGSNKKKIYIKPEGLEESIVIDLEVLCHCQCETSTNTSVKSSSCSNFGTLKCGVCDCDSGYFGKTCECNKETAVSNDISQCKQNENDTKICSGVGVCKCGQCRCNTRPNPKEKYFSKFCECDNFSCKKVDEKLCSMHGACECGGVCNCYAGWEGEACECSTDKSTCVKPDGRNLECNGHGTCKCGKCQCFEEGVEYSGKYCDECPTCGGQRCEELRHCVECHAYKTGMFTKAQCKNNCTKFTPQIVEKIDRDRTNENEKTCTIIDASGCGFVFQYEYDDEHLTVKVEKNKFCYGPPNILAWVLGVIGSVILAGLIILIIWKICTTIHDRKEYSKFERERSNLQWNRNDNPLYREATSTFPNPVYRRSRLLSFSKKS